MAFNKCSHTQNPKGEMDPVFFPGLPLYPAVITARGTRVMFHSARSFIRVPAGAFCICTASLICLSMESFLNDPVTDISNDCISPSCSSRQCLHNGELSTFLPVRSVMCLFPRVYPFPDVSPLYVPFSHSPPSHLIWYVMFSRLQFPFPDVVQTKQSFLPHPPSWNGLDVCSWLFNVLPVRSTVLMRSPLFLISSSYIRFSLPPGVDGTNRTESNPPCLYHSLLFLSFSATRSALFQVFGR